MEIEINVLCIPMIILRMPGLVWFGLLRPVKYIPHNGATTCAETTLKGACRAKLNKASLTTFMCRTLVVKIKLVCAYWLRQLRFELSYCLKLYSILPRLRLLMLTPALRKEYLLSY